MTIREQKRKCKEMGCNEWFIASTASMAEDRMQGYSVPEYCPKHRAMHSKSYSRIAVHHIDITETEAGTELLRRVEAAKAEGIQIPLGPGGIGQFERPLRPFLDSENPESTDRDFPIAQKDAELLSALDNYQVVILVGPTGSGKSTHVPRMLLRSKWSRRGPIVVTQPRIQATVQIPHFVARLNNSSYGPGAEIGYSHSKSQNYDRRTRLLFMTDGKLINDIVSGQISTYSIIMIDEAHERSVNIDLILGLLREQLYLYPHLRLIIASATIDHGTFVRYFGADGQSHVPLIKSEGKFYGYDRHWWQGEDEQGKIDLGEWEIEAEKNETDPGWWEKVNGGVLPEREALPEAIADLVEYLCKKLDTLPRALKQEKDGHILVFLPGKREIDRTVSAIDARKLPNLLTLPLYAQRPMDEQSRALNPTDSKDKAMRRVVVSTNVAETSLTVEGVKYVIDSGYVKESYWDPRTEVNTLMTVRHSKAGCKQRWGRAGRTAPGEVYMLYTRQQFQETFPNHTSPEIARASLEQVILTALAAGVRDITRFAWMPLEVRDETRFREELARALGTLRARKAVDDKNELTERGLELRGVPVTLDMATVLAEADRYALAVEVATLLPFLSLERGLQNILKWDAEWDSVKQLNVREQHLALTYGCRDDLDLYLKLWMIWESLSTNERHQWCDEAGVDFKTFKENIDDERKKLLGSVMDRRKDEERTILSEKLDVLRIIIAAALTQELYIPFQKETDATEEIASMQWESYWEGADFYQEYEDDFEFDPLLVSPSSNHGIFHRLHLASRDVTEDALVEIAPISICYSRTDVDLFVACQRKANYLRPARAKSLALNLVRFERQWLSILSASRTERALFNASLSRGRSSAEHMATKIRLFLPWLAPKETAVHGVVRDWKEGVGGTLSIIVPPSAENLIGALANIPISVEGWLDAKEQPATNDVPPSIGEGMTCYVIGYGETKTGQPRLFLSRRQDQQTAFLAFKQRYKERQSIQVEMRRVLLDPLGSHPVFVVRELFSGLDIAMSAGDFCGNTRYRPYFGLRFEVSEPFWVDIEEVDSKASTVRLSRVRSLLEEYALIPTDTNNRIVPVRVVRVDAQGAYLKTDVSPYISFVRRVLWPPNHQLRPGEQIATRLRRYERDIDIRRLREQMEAGEPLPRELDLGIEFDLRIPPAFERFKARHHGQPLGKMLLGVLIDRLLDNGSLLLDIGDELRAVVYADELGLNEEARFKTARDYKPGERIDVRVTHIVEEQARVRCSIIRVEPVPASIQDPVSVRILMIQSDRSDVEKHHLTCLLDNKHRVRVSIMGKRPRLNVGDPISIHVTKVRHTTMDILGSLVEGETL